METRSDVLILGGGAMGLAIAFELALQGVSVTILSRNFAEAALHAAAGMLAPRAEGILPGPMLELCLRSRALYPDWIDKLESLTGMNSEYWPCGILAPHYPNAEVPSDDGMAGSGKGEWCDRPKLDALQPGLSAEVRNGWWFPEDGQVNNQKLAQVLAMAVQHLGVIRQEGVTIERIVHDQTQITGVETSHGVYAAAHYVLATGAWSGKLWPIPVVPRKGQMLAVQTGLGCPSLEKVLFGSEVYIVPRRQGRIIIGATSETVGFMPHNTPAGIQQLLTAATRLYPPLKDWILELYWWGFRPATPDELPILGPSPYQNLLFATGHYRNGILLAPVTAALIAEVICQQRLDPLLDAFTYRRFDHSQLEHSQIEQAPPDHSVQFTG